MSSRMLVSSKKGKNFLNKIHQLIHFIYFLLCRNVIRENGELMRRLFKFQYILFTILACAILSSCSLLDRRDFEDEMEFTAFEEPLIIPGREFEVVPGDNGRAYRSEDDIYRRTPATERDRALYSHHSSIKYELYSLENRQSDSDYNDYLKVQDTFTTDSERIYFLRLNSKDRKEYLEARRISLDGTSWSLEKSQFSASKSRLPSRQSYRNQTYRNQTFGNWRRPAVNNRHMRQSAKALQLGMPVDEVKSAWGRPMRRDIAGPDGAGNERWTYQMGDQVKYIYFEGGRVEGWTEQ